jgi:hypothetical protein
VIDFNPDLLFIKHLNCAVCANKKADFYLKGNEPHCCGCNSLLLVTDSDIASVSGRSERAPILRFKSKVGVS